MNRNEVEGWADRAFARDALARVTRIAEYVQDAELEEAALALEDLAGDLWKLAALEEAA